MRGATPVTCEVASVASEAASPPSGPPPTWTAHRPAGIDAFLDAILRYRLDRERLRTFGQPDYDTDGSLSNIEWRSMRDRLAKLFPDFTSELFEDASHLNTPHQREPPETR